MIYVKYAIRLELTEVTVAIDTQRKKSMINSWMITR